MKVGPEVRFGAVQSITSTINSSRVRQIVRRVLELAICKCPEAARAGRLLSSCEINSELRWLKMKIQNVALADRVRFAVILAAGWLLLSSLLYFAFDMTIGIYMSSYPLRRALMYATMVIAFAILQRQLINSCFRVNFQHWLRWTVAGAAVGALCHEIFTAAIPSPSEFWWYRRISPPPSAQDLFIVDAYHAIRWFFRFGLVVFFQAFALPSDLPIRRLWLLAAIVAAPLWHSHSWIAVIIIALALDRIALWRYRFHFDKVARKRSQTTLDPCKARAALSSPNSPAPASSFPTPRRTP